LAGGADLATNYLNDKRGAVKRLFSFYSLPTVPTIRIVYRGNIPVLELGKRARVRDNSLCDAVDKKGWDISSSPIPIIQGKQMEMGYITHPAGCTVQLVPNVKVMAADPDGEPVKITIPKLDAEGKPVIDPEGKPVMVPGYKYIDANFEGMIGTDSDLDDFNESTERVQSRGWVVPLLLGIIAGVVFFAPLFAYLMAFVSGAGK
jgi:hypothetical protein